VLIKRLQFRRSAVFVVMRSKLEKYLMKYGRIQLKWKAIYELTTYKSRRQLVYNK